jgi:DNA-binding NarL/FixJ family response regulator
VLVFAPDAIVLRWIEHELFAERVTMQVVASLADLVTTLTLVPPPWPQFLIIDVTALSAAEVELLRGIREAGWPGTVIAIGDASEDMRRSLGIDRVLDRSLESEALRTAIKQAGVERANPLRRLAR